MKISLIKNLNYKDIIIILSLWYFMAVISYLTKNITFNYTPNLTNLFHYLFILADRFIYLALVLFYLTSFYPISFNDLDINFINFKKQIILAFSLIIGLFLAVLFLINIPLSFKSLYQQFSPLYKADNPEEMIKSFFPFILLFLANIIISLSEQILLNKIIFEFLNNTFNHFFALILTSLFYSFLLLTFTPTKIIMNFIIAFISLYLYLKNNSLLTSSLFIAAYYSIYIFYIYGWNFIRF